MAYNITKPNIYFSGDKNVLNESTAGDKSKFNVKMTHAKDDMYCVIAESTKDVIEISIEPSGFIDDSVLTNYILFNGDFSEKTILFVTSDGYEIYYSGDYTRAKYTENTIIAIQQISSNKIVVCLEEGEKEYKYGVLLTLETTSPNETVYYTNPADSINLSNVKMYWNYNPETCELGTETHDNSKVYSDAGKHYLVVISGDDLKFPAHASTISSYNDISNHLIKIDKYKNYKPILVKENTGCYFANYEKLQKIVTGIFNQNITDFYCCFMCCSSLAYIPAGLFDSNKAATNFTACFSACSSLTSIPDGLFDNNTLVTDFHTCFYSCSSLVSIPNSLFDNNTAVTNFYNCFWRCSSLTYIPDGLFDNNTLVTDFDSCFGNCSSLTSIPDGLFDNNTLVTDFKRCFSNCSSITSAVPELWNTTKWPNVTEKSLCFSGCTKAANYLEIPDNWKMPES